MSKITNITSASHLKSVQSNYTYVVADFYADWCGPCKTIAPIFDQLAQTESKPGRMSFVKIDVDSQQDIARTYGVTAMPTFLIFKNGSVSETIRGANPSSLRAAVQKASADAAKGPAKQSAAFSSGGRTLGASSISGGGSTPKTTPMSIPTASGSGFANDLIRFLGLYVTTLFSLDAYAAAEQSPFSVKNRARTQ